MIVVEDDSRTLAELLRSDVTVMLRLMPIADFLFRAIRVGGNDEQMKAVKQLTERRLRALREAALVQRPSLTNSSKPSHQGPAIVVHRKTYLNDDEDKYD